MADTQDKLKYMDKYQQSKKLKRLAKELKTRYKLKG